MTLSSAELREKDVVNLCNGQRLGYICDFLIDTECGKIKAIFVSDNFFGFNAQKKSLKIPWEKITCIGEDTILVDFADHEECDHKHCECNDGKNHKKKKPWFCL